MFCASSPGAPGPALETWETTDPNRSGTRQYNPTTPGPEPNGSGTLSVARIREVEIAPIRPESAAKPAKNASKMRLKYTK
jgi:hypothetical protein